MVAVFLGVVPTLVDFFFRDLVVAISGLGVVLPLMTDLGFPPVVVVLGVVPAVVTDFLAAIPTVVVTDVVPTRVAVF